VTTFQKFANGVDMPTAARRALGLDAAGSSPATRSSSELALPYPDTPAEVNSNWR
jgi:hypothetical protein